MTLHQIAQRLSRASQAKGSGKGKRTTNYSIAAEIFGCLPSEFHAAAVTGKPELLSADVLARIACAGYNVTG